MLRGVLTTCLRHRSQTPRPSPCALPCLGSQATRQGVAAPQAQPPNLQNAMCEPKNARPRKFNIRDENKRSTLPPSPGGSRSAASATAAAVSARAFASSALSSCSCSCAVRSADVGACFCLWCALCERDGEAAREDSEGWCVRLRFRGAMCWDSTASVWESVCVRRRWQPCVWTSCAT